MNSHRTKSFTTIVIALIGASFLAPSSSVATAEPVWGDGTIVTFASPIHSPNGGGEVKSISCSSAGNCTAVGEFTGPSTHPQAFTMTSSGGVWGDVEPVEFDSGVRTETGESDTRDVSCTSAGNCVAIGYFRDTLDRDQAFITSSSSGAWTPAVPVVFTGGALLNSSSPVLKEISCSVGGCTVVGYATKAGKLTPFAISSTGGTWGTPATWVLPNPATEATLNGFSCVSAGNCTAFGTLYLPQSQYRAFAVTSTSGSWGPITMIPFPDNTLNSFAESELTGISCASAGNCSAVGYFVNTAGDYLGFTVTSTGGDWSLARPESATHFPNAIHCTSTGNCTVVGEYRNVSGRTQPYTVTSTSGAWGSPEPVSFAAGVQNASPTAVLQNVSCSSIGSCTATGYYRNTDGANEAFTTTSVGGVWGTARPVVYATGSGASRRPGYIKAVSCTSGGLCTVGGRFTLSSGNDEIFVMSSNEAPPVTTTLPATTVPSSSTVAPTTTLAPPALDTVRALPPAPTPIVADNSIDTGEAITVSFGGFTPFEYVQLVVASTPQVIGSGYANAQGVVTLTGNLPTNLTSGTHTLAVYAPGSGIGFTQPITVTALTLPTTGSSRGDGGAQVALWVLLAGIGAIVVARRRNA